MNLLAIIDGFGASPDSIAHIHRERILTYSELRQKSDALASYLIAEYGDDRSPVVVYGHKQYEMIISFLGCVKAGHAYIPVDSSLPYERVREIINNSVAKIIINIGDSGWNDDGKTRIIDPIMFCNLLLEYRGRKPGHEHRVQSDDDFYIIYTSGSTGKPKGVRITLSCLVSFIEWGLRICGPVCSACRFLEPGTILL